MQETEEFDDAVFDVVVNDEEQYSIWRNDMPLPLGWTNAGFQGFKDECLAYIDAHWTDMRPLSVRRDMEARQR
ncbi:MbtH protein [Actinacidiphila yanglinensis]|uniref:MbtH protein n=1 Tax=Actinacidiphila yanglinensis TaxID=310779 RepID=A0A1H6DGR8_9ACTN|nr:MbtH family NRPS accessory protein [Actinacidiphila yanglinensis]SEG84414.1 MbtH protein [Actinacidiphila yanglinensis]